MRDTLTRSLRGPMRVTSSLAPPEAEPAAGEGDPPDLAGWRRRHTDRHTSPEILFALSGRASCRLNDRCYTILPGDWLVFAGGDIHDDGYPPGAGAAEHVWIRCGGGAVTWQGYRIDAEGYAPVDGTMYDLGDERFASWLRHEIEYLRAAARAAGWSAESGAAAGADDDKKAEGEAAMRARHLRGVIACLAGRMHARVLADPPLAGDARRTRAVQLARRWIAEKRGVNLTVDAVARHAGYNQFYFMRLFKEMTGLTVKECIAREQSAHCGRLLAGGVAKKRIAAELGFSSPAAFSHWLRRRG